MTAPQPFGFNIGTIEFKGDWDTDLEKSTATHNVYKPSEHTLGHSDQEKLSKHPAIASKVHQFMISNAAPTDGVAVATLKVPGMVVSMEVENGTVEYQVKKVKLMDPHNGKILIYWPEELKEEGQLTADEIIEDLKRKCDEEKKKAHRLRKKIHKFEDAYERIPMHIKQSIGPSPNDDELEV